MKKRPRSPEQEQVDPFQHSFDNVFRLHQQLHQQILNGSEFDASNAAIFHTISLHLLKPIMEANRLPPAEAFSGTPTLCKLIGFHLVIKRLAGKKCVEIPDELQHSAENYSKLIHASLGVLEHYICALCSSLRDTEPLRKRFKSSDPFGFDNNLSSGIEQGLLCLQDSGTGYVRRLFRRKYGCKVYTLEELEEELGRQVAKFSLEYFHHFPDVKLVPASTTFPARYLHNNPSHAFLFSSTTLFMALSQSSFIPFPIRILLSSLLSVHAQIRLRRFFGTD